jgi:hypothetical protein
LNPTVLETQDPALTPVPSPAKPPEQPGESRRLAVKAIADEAYDTGFAEGWSTAMELLGVAPAPAPGKAAAT